MAPPINPRNVPTGGDMTYAALQRITSKQLRMISQLKRTAGSPPTWDATCGIVLGNDWDGVYESLSVAAGSWLIHNLQAGLLAVSQPGDLNVQGSPV